MPPPAAAVEEVVFSSVAGAESNRIVPHHRVEQHLFKSGLGWTILRPGFFAQNIGGPYRRDIVASDRIFIPAGSGRVAFIDARDIGAVAALALTEDGHRSQAYHLTGPQAVTLDEVAALLTEVLGRPIHYQPASAVGYLRHLRRQGLVMPQAVVQTILHVGLRRGDAEPVTDTVERCSAGRPRRCGSTSSTTQRCGPAPSPPPAEPRPSRPRRRRAAWPAAGSGMASGADPGPVRRPRRPR